MNLFHVSRTAFFILLLTAIVIAEEKSAYQKGTITQDFSTQHKWYDLKTGDNGYAINDCGDFQNGQVVDYRATDDKVYIRREDGKESKCAIEAKIVPSVPTIEDTPKYLKGTIAGYEVRRDTHIGGGGGGGNGTPANPVSTWTRHAKVYELRGTDLIYKVDYCGAFQAGKFTPGQVVEYRVDGDRLYIRHDEGKEYSCQLEGTRNVENAKAEETAQPGAVSSAPAAAPVTAATAKLSITSVPDGGDIEVDGNFSGNTPSDLEVPEGEHSITVKIPGFKTWERKMKVVAGSSIHLNAEMEKTTNQ